MNICELKKGTGVVIDEFDKKFVVFIMYELKFQTKIVP